MKWEMIFILDKVSVIITTYKGQDVLSRSLNSVLSQTYANIEILVVDDNPPSSVGRKKTELLMQKYSSCIYIRHPKNMNGAVARNTGVRHATGKWICFLDDDDYMLTDRISNSVAFMDSHVDAYGMCGRVILPSESGVRLSPNIETLSPSMLLLNMNILGSGSNIFISRDFYEAINGFDESFIRHQDVEFMVRASQSGTILGSQEIVAIKFEGDTQNIPKYESLKLQKTKLTEKFRLLLESDPELFRRYNEMNAVELIYSSKAGTRIQRSEARRRLQAYRKLTLRELIASYGFDIQKNKVLKMCVHFIRAAKSKSSWNRFFAQNQDIPEGDLRFLRSIVS